MKPKSHIAILLAASLTLALGACSSSSADDPPTDPPEDMTDTTPEPDPGPSDLDETQMAAKAAADAAKMASDGAEAAAAGAEAATANIATIQTDGMAAMAAMDARKYADMAMAEYMKAKAASDAAAGAATGPAAETAWRNAVNAQDAAEAAAEMAGEKAMAATDAAKMELHIDGTMKMVGESSIDASADKMTSPTGDRITGFISKVTRSLGERDGQAYDEDASPAQPYRQAVDARTVGIGKTLDTSDDKARLMLIDSRASSVMARVYVVNDAATEVTGTVTSDGRLQTAGTDTAADDSDDVFTTLRSLGMYYEATEGDTNGTVDVLEHTDSVGAKTKPKELFSTSAGTVVVETERTILADGSITVEYQPVDNLAPAAPDGHGAANDDQVAEGTEDSDETPESIVVRAAIPMAKAYSHIHFGVWAGLGDAAKDGSQMVTDLGIGFVQNIGEGMPTGTGIGTASYNGDWVAAVQRENAQGAGSINLRQGSATLMADFEKAKFTGTLTGLATLEGAISGYGFSGTKATVDRNNADLDSTGTFAGSFSGGIYGNDGSEAAGVFDFNGGEAGAFRGAFGGTNQD